MYKVIVIGKKIKIDNYFNGCFFYFFYVVKILVFLFRF